MRKGLVTTKRMLEYLENGDFEIKFSWIDKRTLALIDPAKEVILINLHLHLTESYIHEY